MDVIGERINGMFKAVKNAIVEKDAGVIQKLAKDQLDAGAHILDVNVGPSAADTAAAMDWLVKVIREVTDAPLAIDSPKEEILEVGLKAAGPGSIVNSTTGQKEKLDAILPLVAKYDASIIALTIDEKGIPRDAAARAEIALAIVAAAVEAGIPTDKLYIDPVILPCNVAQPQAPQVLEAIKQVPLLADPAPKTVLGLSNVSQGTQKRELINRTYLVMALGAGLDAAIMDPLDSDLMDAAITSELLLNKHIYCDSFLDAYRK